MVSCLYISYMLLIFEYKLRVSSLIVINKYGKNICLNQHFTNTKKEMSSFSVRVNYS